MNRQVEKKGGRKQPQKSIVVLLVVGRWQVEQSNSCLSDLRNCWEKNQKRKQSIYKQRDRKRLMLIYTEFFHFFHFWHVTSLTLCPSLFGCLHSIMLLLMKAFALFIWSSLLGSVTGQHLVLHQLPWRTKTHTLIHWSEKICNQIKCTHSGAYSIWA